MRKTGEPLITFAPICPHDDLIWAVTSFWVFHNVIRPSAWSVNKVPVIWPSWWCASFNSIPFLKTTSHSGCLQHNLRWAKYRIDMLWEINFCFTNCVSQLRTETIYLQQIYSKSTYSTTNLFFLKLLATRFEQITFVLYGAISEYS